MYFMPEFLRIPLSFFFLNLEHTQEDQSKLVTPNHLENVLF